MSRLKTVTSESVLRNPRFEHKNTTGKAKGRVLREKEISQESQAMSEQPGMQGSLKNLGSSDAPKKLTSKAFNGTQVTKARGAGPSLGVTRSGSSVRF